MQLEASPPLSGRVTPPPISRWAILGLGTVAIFFALTAVISQRNQSRFLASEHLATESRLFVVELGEAVSLLQTAEAEQRTYFLTDEQDYLDAYYDASSDVTKMLRGLNQRAKVLDRQREVAALDKAISARLAHLQATLELGQGKGRSAAAEAVRSGHGQALMSDVLKQARSIQAVEQDALADRRAQASNALRLTHVSDLVTAAIGLGLAVAAFIRLRREFLERHAVARDLDEQREQLQVTLHSIADAVVTTDPEGRIRTLNAAAERMTNWSTAQARDLNASDVLEIRDEKTRAKVEDSALQAIRERRSVKQPSHALLVGKDGTERRIESMAAPIRTPDGRVLGAVLTFRDVTERKRAEDAVRRGEERLRRTLRAAHMVAWELDIGADVVVRSENATDLTGLPSFGPVAEWQALIHPEDRERVEHEFARAMRGECDYDVEYRFMLADGRTMWVADKGEVRRNAAGEPTHIVGVFIDITSRRQAEEDLREADRRKDRFLATLAHELRNPLAPVSNALQAWPFVKDKPAELERLRDTMGRQVRQMTRLIDDLMDVSRISRGKMVLERKPVDLGQVLEAAIEGTAPAVEARNHRLTFSLPQPAPLVHGDQARLVQVFANLITNAAKYTDQGGRIDVAVTIERDAPERVAISVSDDGAGIPKGMLADIFQMFAQVDHTLDRAHGGLGIGLTLVRTLVELHGGTVEAESPGPGKGATFTVTLPVLRAEAIEGKGPLRSAGGAAASPGAFAQDGASAAGSVSNRVLVVDDMRPSARTMQLLLQGMGHEVRMAHDGKTALACLEEFEAEVVLLDIAMPGMDGYEVARRIRERNCRQPMLVALTGYGRAEDRAEAFAAGFDRHLVKPASLDDLKSLFSEVVAASRSPQPS